ncbi:MAG: FG-GAP-like repeat-containing protein [Rhodothermales bacterium]|nr:FG-GAP-like repeat-containing protein [Rhodothermales bacterium]MDG2015991.1 FG-GAP-like repeat-containing protein [Rhodothermales bacterium]
MRRVTNFFLALTFLFVGSAFGQSTDYSFISERSPDPQSPYPALHSGTRTVAGPYDLDGDGKQEVLVSDYTGGSRVHVLEVVGPDTWEHVYSTPWLDDTASTNNGRVIAGGDMDGDGKGEIYFFSGYNFAEGSPYPVGLYAFEHTGVDNDYGTAPTTIYQMGDDQPNRWRQEQVVIQDFDNDGKNEMMFGNNGNNAGDNWWIISVDGDIGSGFETWTNEAYINSRSQPWDDISRGGGSPYGSVAADLDGNGINELVLGSWNNFNITLGQATAPDTYFWPDGAQGPHWAHLNDSRDTVPLFGLDVIDIDQNGDDEVFGAEYPTGNVFVINYEAGENVFAITPDNYSVALEGFSSLGLTAGDLDGDGNIDLIGSGAAYSSGQYEQDLAPNWVNIVEFIGTNPEDPTHYSDVVNVFFPNDRTDAFDLITQDSAGVLTTFRSQADNGPQFASKFAFLGDVDDDGQNEVALGFQGQSDSLRTFTTVFNPADSTYVKDESTEVTVANPVRVFMRILSAGAVGISIEDERVIIPTDYKLEQNYPNPFNPTTSIRFELPRDKAVSLTIFDVSGRIVKTLVDNQQMAEGAHEMQWDGTNDAGASVASGTYLYRLSFGNFAHTKTMVLLK